MNELRSEGFLRWVKGRWLVVRSYCLYFKGMGRVLETRFKHSIGIAVRGIVAILQLLFFLLFSQMNYLLICDN